MISIIIPVFNAEDTIQDCILSIVRYNTCDFEIIAIDDGSTDNSLMVLNELSKSYPSIHVYHQINQGNSLTRQNALNYVKGNYTLFVDADDSIEPHSLEILQNHTQNLSQPDLIIFGWFTDYLVDHKQTQRCFPQKNFSTSYDAAYELLKHGGFNLLWNKLYKTCVIQGFRDFPITKCSGQDFVFNCHVFQRLSKVAMVSDCLYHYTKRPTETMVTRYIKDGLSNLRMKESALEEMMTFFNQPSNDSINDYMLREYQVYVLNLFSEHCPYTRTDKINDIRDCIYNDVAYTRIKKSRPIDQDTAFFKKLVLLKSPSLIVSTYSFLFGIKKHFGVAFNRIHQCFNK